MFLRPWELPEIVWFHRIRIWKSNLKNSEFDYILVKNYGVNQGWIGHIAVKFLLSGNLKKFQVK